MAGTEGDPVLIKQKSGHHPDGSPGDGDKSKLLTDNLVGTEIGKMRAQSKHPEFPATAKLLRQLEGHQPASRSNDRTLPSDASVEQARKFLADGKGEPADLTKLCAGALICSIGENHDSLAAKELLAKQVPALAQAGYTQFGFEMIRSENQRDLDDYLAGKISKDVLLSDKNFGDYEFQPGGPEKYVEIMDAIKDYNQVHGTHLRALALDDQDHSDKHWAGIVHQAMVDNPAAKIITYSGKGHLLAGVTKPWCDFSCELNKLGRPSRTVISIDSKDPKKLNPGVLALDDARFVAGATQAGIDSPVAIPLTKTEKRRADYAVFAPWEELPKPVFGKTIQEGDGQRTAEIPIPGQDGVDGRLQLTFAADGTVDQLRFAKGTSTYTIAGRPDDRKYHPGGGGGGGGGGGRGAKDISEDLGGWQWYDGGLGLPAHTFYRLKSSTGEPLLTVWLDPGSRLQMVRANPTLLYPPNTPQ